MSLINDVLRQVDSNATAGTRADVAAIMPVPVTDTARNNIAGFVFSSVASLLVFILMLQLMSEKSLFSLFENDIKDSDTSISNSQPLTSDIYTVIESSQPDIDDSKALGSVSDMSLRDDSSVDGSHSASSNNIREKFQAPKASITASKSSNVHKNTPDKIIALASYQSKDIKIDESSDAADENQNFNSVTISSKSLAPGEKEYQKALQLFIDDNLKLSESYIQLAIEKNNLEKFYALQARIYIKQKDSDKFYSLVKDHPDNNSLDWFKLIAPGLQLFSYYQLSNKYYYSLTKVEPDQIRWQLAIALNYLRLGDNEKAISTYKELYKSDQVSNQQRQWLIKKIERLSAEKG